MGNKFVRDPQAKQRAVILAAAELLLEVGPAALTHRLIAQRAEVSLGTTTRYFATKKDIEIAAITHLSNQRQAAIDNLEANMAAADKPERVLAQHLYECMLVEPASQRLLAYMAANADVPEASEFVQAWYETFYRCCRKFAPEERARAAANYCDGLFMQHAIRKAPCPSYEEILINLELLLYGKAHGDR